MARFNLLKELYLRFSAFQRTPKVPGALKIAAPLLNFLSMRAVVPKDGYDVYSIAVAPKVLAKIKRALAARKRVAQITLAKEDAPQRKIPVMFEFTPEGARVEHYDLDSLAKSDAAYFLKRDYSRLHVFTANAVADVEAAFDAMLTLFQGDMKIGTFDILSVYARLIAFVALLRKYIGTMFSNATEVITTMAQACRDVPPEIARRMKLAINVIDPVLQKEKPTMDDYNAVRPLIYDVCSEALSGPMMSFMLLLWKAEGCTVTPRLRVIFQRMLGISTLRFEYVQKCMQLLSKILRSPPCKVETTFWNHKLDKTAKKLFAMAQKNSHPGKLSVSELIMLVPFWDPALLSTPLGGGHGGDGSLQEWTEFLAQVALSFDDGFEVNSRPESEHVVVRVRRTDEKKGGKWKFWKTRAGERC
ncbi:hypothetical protein HDU96_003058 [Phlyctochytrium bullatum]|nr:hypothetical protein HDU96_003058 [Phlyctochytrium bullatum]